MTVYYLDASVIVKRYLSEPGAEVTRLVLSSGRTEDRIYTSFISLLEVTSAIHRIIGSRSDDVSVREALARFGRDVREVFRLWPLDHDLIADALPIVEQYRLRAGDAVHLTSCLAIAARAGDSQVVMVSSDRELVRAATAAGHTALDPTGADALNLLHQIRASAS